MAADRSEAMHEFLRGTDWRNAVVTPLPGDASTRRYFRVAQDSRAAMLMDQPQNAEAPPSPPNATTEQRQALGYNAVARLAGADCGRFIAIAEFLRAQGLSAPEIYAAAPADGFVLMESLDGDLYADFIPRNGNEAELYKSAIEVLAKLHSSNTPQNFHAAKPLHLYDETALLAEIDLLPQWLFPVALGRHATPDEITEHRALWHDALASVLSDSAVFVHRDYHAQNLIWLPQRNGVSRVGIIDFQDAVAGSAAYDLVSLLEDARRDVPPELHEAMVKHYIEVMYRFGTSIDEKRLRAAMAIMAAQRNAKIVGIFSRLHKRDGKPRYLDYLPRVWNYLNADLQHPALARLSTWYDRVIPRELRGKPQLETAGA
ncbi:MAG TPA: phosphotransferase [Rhizomicrobium sp.]|jgi:aminoglycoside/choline kinase family phosphotransferase|nr:phosphotransferase [Rhizomicrobium sp.]